MKKNRVRAGAAAIIGILMAAGSAYGAGTTSGEFLKLGIGERAVGMGGAFSSIVDNVTAVYWNPAGLAQLTTQEISAMHMNYLVEIKSDYLGYAHPLGLGSLGLQLSVLYLKDERWVDNSGPAGTFWDYEGVLGVGYGAWVNSRLSLGATLKGFYSKLDSDEVKCFGADIGGLYRTGISGLNIGAVVQNISAGMVLPLNLKVGVSYRMFGSNLIVASDLNVPYGGRSSLNMGGEYWYVPVEKWGLKVATRLGFDTFGLEGFDVMSAICAGLGFQWKGYAMDYAWVPYGQLGNTHRISFSAKF